VETTGEERADRWGPPVSEPKEIDKLAEWPKIIKIIAFVLNGAT
jgi:hypothetical protein